MKWYIQSTEKGIIFSRRTHRGSRALKVWACTTYKPKYSFLKKRVKLADLWRSCQLPKDMMWVVLKLDEDNKHLNIFKEFERMTDLGWFSGDFQKERKMANAVRLAYPYELVEYLLEEATRPTKPPADLKASQSPS